MTLGHLGINRANMPRVKRRQTEAFKRFLSANGIAWKLARVRACDIEDSQVDLDPEKIRRVAARVKSEPGYAAKKLGPPLFVSKDGFLLDGHHRLAVRMLIAGSTTLTPVVLVDLPIRDLLRVASGFRPT